LLTYIFRKNQTDKNKKICFPQAGGRHIIIELRASNMLLLTWFVILLGDRDLLPDKVDAGVLSSLVDSNLSIHS